MSNQSVSTTSNTTLGALLLVFGLLLFSCQDVIIKYFSDRYSVLQLVFLRGIIAIFLFGMLFRYSREVIPLISQKPGLTISRGLLGFSSYISYYLAVAAMPLAEVVSITFTMPLFVTAMSAMILRERVGLRRWSAVIIGFAGVVIILSPEGQFNNWLAVGLAFFAAISYASMTIITRFLGSHDHPTTIAFNTVIVFTVASGVLSLVVLSGAVEIDSDHASLAFFGRDWKMMENYVDVLLIIATGFIAMIGFYCLSRAYCVAEASAIAPFEFTYILWAVVFGYLFWQEIPGPTTLLGIFILISSSLYIWNRERVLAKRQSKTEQQTLEVARQRA